MTKILILTTNKEKEHQSEFLSRWGNFSSSDSRYESIKVLLIKNFIFNTIAYIRNDFDVLFMHNCNPIRFFPLHIIKKLFPNARKKRVICLCHASIYGKSRRADRFQFLGSALSWMMKGYDQLLFFSEKSLEESVKSGIQRERCKLVHWGADVNNIYSHVSNVKHSDYWLSAGKENRDYCTMQKACETLTKRCELRILQKGMAYKDVLRLTANSKGVLVIPNKKGLNYCTGLTCVVEAFALGKPIVAVRNPYYPFDLEREGCGIYVDLESPQQIVEAIDKIDQDDELYESMCKQSLRMSRTYNMENYMRELESCMIK